MVVKLAKPRLMRFANNAVTDHNRQPLQIDTTRIENEQRMANGTLRKWFVADKRTFTIDWQNVPGNDVNTVDGYWGADSLENFYLTTTGVFVLELTMALGDVQTYNVMWNTFSKTLTYRGMDDIYTVNATLEEV